MVRRLPGGRGGGLDTPGGGERVGWLGGDGVGRLWRLCTGRVAFVLLHPGRGSGLSASRGERGGGLGWAVDADGRAGGPWVCIHNSRATWLAEGAEV